MDLYEAMRTTFACREFSGEPVSDEVLGVILENARFAPSGGNRQGGHIIVVRDPATKAELARLAEPAAKRYAAQIRAGESPWNAVNPTAVSAETIASTPAPAALTQPFVAADLVLVVCVNLGLVASMDQDLDRIGMISGASIYPMVWNILLAARAEGCGGTITTLAIAREPELKALLGLPDDHAVAAVMPIGRPLKQLTKLRRRPVAEFVSVDRFDGRPFES
ncbi:MAG: nitroreductase family protein [Pseudomonadota bacterium]